MVSRKQKIQNHHAVFVQRQKKICGIFLALMIMILAYQRIPDRNIWVDHWIARRDEQGAHNNLFLELRCEKPDKFRKCLRMTPEMYDWLLQKVSPYIRKKDTHLRKSIPPSARLSITLRHLATGESQESLSLLYRVGQSAISRIIKETCKAIHLALKDTYLQFPKSEVEWKNVAAEYGERWNFSNCIGAMDGKHIVRMPPLKSGTMFYNYKETFGFVPIGCQGGNRHADDYLALRDRWCNYFKTVGSVPWQERMVTAPT